MSPKASWMLVNEILPRLQVVVPTAVKRVGYEDAEELVQDGVALAARMLINAEANGKAVTAGNVAYYTIQHLKSGRRSTGHSNCDVLGSATQMNGRASTSSFEETLVSDCMADCTITVADLISGDQDDPAQQAMRKLDWDTFLGTLDNRMRTLLEWMAEDRMLSGLAKRWKVSASTMTNKKVELAKKLKEFFGEDVLAVIAQQPGWSNDLHVMREWIACKYERCGGR